MDPEDSGDLVSDSHSGSSDFIERFSALIIQIRKKERKKLLKLLLLFIIYYLLLEDP
jgi:hypothetical protein